MDEADRLLEASFEPDLRAILTKLPAKRQTLLFSATMTRNLAALQKAVLHDAYHFQVSSLCTPSGHSTYSPARCYFPCAAVLQHWLSDLTSNMHSDAAQVQLEALH